MSEEPRAWLARAGRYAERAQWALDHGCTPAGYGEVGDLSSCASQDEIRDLYASVLPDAKVNSIRAYAAQLWILVHKMAIGDWIVMPTKSPAGFSIGRITSDYHYDAAEPDPEKRHVRKVEWVRTDVPRSDVKQDLLYVLGAFLTYCEVKRNDAARRIGAVAATGKDPGASGLMSTPVPPEVGPDDVEASVDVEQYANDRILAMVREQFSGHAMQELVAAVLRARGFTCRVSPEGPDGGVDILAGSGPLGMDTPRLVVQVKSEQSAVGEPVVTQLLGATGKHREAQALLVAWGGLTPAARKSVVDNYFKVRVWDAEELVRQVTTHYQNLPEEIRADLPLKPIWVPVEEAP